MSISSFTFTYIAVVETGEIIHTLEGKAATLSHDGATIATIRDDEFLMLWDFETGLLIKDHDPRISSMVSLAFSPDDTALTIGDRNGIVWVWDIETNETIYRLDAHNETITQLAYSPDGVTLAVASQDATITIWDIESADLLQTLTEHRNSINDITYSPDGTLFASTGSLEYQTIIWNTDTWEPEHRLLSSSGDAEAVTFSADGVSLFIGSSYGSVSIWNLETFESKVLFNRLTNSIYSPDGTQIAVINDLSIDILDFNTLTKQQTLYTYGCGISDVIVDIIFSLDGRQVAAEINDGNMYIWDVESAERLFYFDMRFKHLSNITYAPDSQTFATAAITSNVHPSSQYSIMIWDSETGEHIQTLYGLHGFVRSLHYSPDGSILTARVGDGAQVVLVWDVETGNILDEILSQQDDLEGCALMSSPASHLTGFEVTIQRQSNILEICDLSIGESIQTIPHTYDEVNSYAFSPDGSLLITTGYTSGYLRADFSMLLWDVVTGKLLYEIVNPHHEHPIDRIIFASDGQTFMTYAPDGKIIIWGITNP